MELAENPARMWLQLRKTASSYWSGLAPREQAGSAGALVVIGIGLLWWLGVAPALRTLRQSEVQQRLLDTQWQQMQRLQAEAQALKARRRIPRDDALRALEASVKSTLGPTAELIVTGDRVTLTLKNTPAQALALWLTQARTNAHAVPAEARLQRSAETGVSPPSAPVKPALSTMPSIGAMPSMGSLPMGVMPGVGLPTGAAPPAGDPMMATIPPAPPRTPASWSGTLLLSLP